MSDLQLNINTNSDRGFNKLGISWSQLILFVLFFYGLSFLIGLGIGTYDLLTKSNLTTNLLVGYKALYIDAFMFILSLLAFRNVRSFIFEKMDFSVLRHKKTYLYIFLSIILFYFSQFLTLEYFKVDDVSGQNQKVGVASVTGTMQQILFFISLAIITPIKEELLYRGILHRFFEVKYNFFVGMIVSSVIFGLLHTGYPISAIIMGAGFSVLYRLTNSLVTPMLLHILWNLYAAILILVNF